MIIEGKAKGKSVHIWALPEPNEILSSLMETSSFFTQEKIDNINEKLKRLDLKPTKRKKASQKVRTTNIMSNLKSSEKNDIFYDEDDEILSDDRKRELIEKEDLF